MLNLIAPRARRFTACTALARDVRLSSLAVDEAIDLVEIAADIAVEVERHRRLGSMGYRWIERSAV